MTGRTLTLVTLLATLPPLIAHAQRDVPRAVTLTARNRWRYTHRLPSGRAVSPIGLINGAPNFVTALALTDHAVLALANGAQRVQTLTFYSRTRLERLGAVRAGKTARPAHGLATLGHQSVFQGLTATAHGRIYVAGGYSDDVVALARAAGRVRVLRRYPLRWQPFPRSQYPYRYQGRHDDRPRRFYPDGLALGPRKRHLFVTGLLANSLARINLRTGHTRYLNVGPNPFTLVAADHGRRLVVSLWGGNAVVIVNPRTFTRTARVPVGPPLSAASRAAGVHPTALAAHGRSVFVALANVDRVAQVNVRTGRLVRVLSDAPYRHAPPGSYPDALAIAHGRLFVANAGNNDVAVFDRRTGARLGLIPTGWYPTALAVTGRALYVASAKGLGSGPNVAYQWVGDMMQGLIQRIPLSDLAHLARLTRVSLRHDGFGRVERLARARRNRARAAFLRRRIRYVVFLLRENKTFDEDFGDDRAAGRWADPRLDLYGPRELPNLYRLARDNTLFAQFFADGEVTAQAHQWTTAASDSDFVQRTWPQYYSNRGLVAAPGWTQSLTPGGASGTGGLPLGADNPYAIYENLSTLGAWSNPWISYPGGLFLFNDLLRHHVSFEDFGEFVARSRAGRIRARLRAHLATRFPGWDRMLLDTRRAALAIRWLEAHPGRRFPHFLYIWLPDDHTAGRAPCYYTPDYYVANNDYATAEIIHYLATTPQWRHMVVFLTEDDAQSGADHINAHRTFALAIGPYVKKGLVDAQPYSQVNILKTIEAILGVPPLSQWDQNAAVIHGIWRRHPRRDHVTVLPMQVPLRINAGVCRRYTLLRREAGVHGQVLPPHWLQAHRDRLGAGPAPRHPYTPTTLLKVPGPVQMRQEWIASRGRAAWHREQAYLAHYARAHHAPIAAFEARH